MASVESLREPDASEQHSEQETTSATKSLMQTNHKSTCDDIATKSQKFQPNSTGHLQGAESRTTPETATFQSSRTHEGTLKEKAHAFDARSSEHETDIHSIMNQFEQTSIDDSKNLVEESREPEHQTIEAFPQRISSLGPQSPAHSLQSQREDLAPSSVVPRPQGGPEIPKTVDTSLITPQRGSTQSRTTMPTNGDTASPLLSPKLNKSLPPAPDPEPDLPFDFHRFLEQLRHRTADPVAKFLRSFLVEFGKKQWMAHEQVKIISDFLVFITTKMQQCEIWREVSDAEFDNAREGMEKLVMNRLYTQAFSPAIPAPASHSPVKGKRKAFDKQPSPGRRGQHQEDVERDEILAQKVQIYSWVKEEHLDIAPVSDSGRRFLTLAQQELLKIGSYRAPRDKIICVLNCCKVIFGLLRNSKSSDTSADSFIPLLIYVVLQANPEHLVSNVQYILRFRSQEKLGGEAGYYLSSLMGAVQFIENLDRTTLTVSDIEFERNVEATVSAIAERKQLDINNDDGAVSDKVGQQQDKRITNLDPESRVSSTTQATKAPEIADRPDSSGEKDAMGNLLRSFQKPLSNIGRIFSEDTTSSNRDSLGSAQSEQARAGGTSQRLSPASFQPPAEGDGYDHGSAAPRSGTYHRPDMDDDAIRQTRGEAVEIRRAQMMEHESVVDTLASMFPNLDRDVIEDVVKMKDGRVGSAVDACLALNT